MFIATVLYRPLRVSAEYLALIKQVIRELAPELFWVPDYSIRPAGLNVVFDRVSEPGQVSHDVIVCIQLPVYFVQVEDMHKKADTLATRIAKALNSEQEKVQQSATRIAAELGSNGKAAQRLATLKAYKLNDERELFTVGVSLVVGVVGWGSADSSH